LTSALYGVEWSASLPSHFTPRKRDPVTQSRSGHGGEKKNSQSLPGLEPPTIQPGSSSITVTGLIITEEYNKITVQVEVFWIVTPCIVDVG
jgi:hypothetical protein